MKKRAFKLQAGGTLDARKHLYIERVYDQQLLKLLLDSQYANILTSRQMGKSSLVMRMIQALTEQNIHTAYIDLTSLGSERDAESYYLGLISDLSRKLKVPMDTGEWWKTHLNETFNQRLLSFFREVIVKEIDAPIVIFLDEIDSTLKLDFTDDLFTAIRSMYNERALIPEYEKITFCLVGVATPNELIKDRRTTAYNVGTTLELGDFSPTTENLTPLTQTLNKNEGIQSGLLGRVIYWTDGHPYLTVKTCIELQREGIKDEAGVDRYVEKTYSRLSQVSSDTHFQQILRFVENRLSNGLETLKLYHRILQGKPERDQTTLAHAELKLSGLVKRNAEGILVVRNRIYQRLFDRAWIIATKPQRELAKYKFRSRVASFALIAVITAMAAFLWWSNGNFYPPAIAAKGLMVQLRLWPVIEPEMIHIPAGKFKMGDLAGDGDQDEQPVHTIVFEQSFEMGVYEVTFNEYDLFAAATGRRLPDDDGWGRGHRPVINVSWQDATDYAQWLAAKTGETYRLPTEAEWEYAARSGTHTKRFWKENTHKIDDIACQFANVQDQSLDTSEMVSATQKQELIKDGWWDPFNCEDGFVTTAPVGSFQKNPWGMHDILGNVWEWTCSGYEEKYTGAEMRCNDNANDSRLRVLRGGSWYTSPRRVRSANRDRSAPSNRSNIIGFRLARTN